MDQKRNHLLAFFAGFVCLTAIDQWTKGLAVDFLKGKGPLVLWDGVFELLYSENRGAAFGMLQNQKAFFIFVAFVILGVIGYVLYKMPDDRKYRILHVLLSLIAAGAIGNMIDRIRLDYVVDFIYFVLINFPIFNIADIYVSVSTAALVILLLFFYKENDLNFISFKQKRYRELK